MSKRGDANVTGCPHVGWQMWKDRKCLHLPEQWQKNVKGGLPKQRPKNSRQKIFKDRWVAEGLFIREKKQHRRRKKKKKGGRNTLGVSTPHKTRGCFLPQVKIGFARQVTDLRKVL